MTMRMFSKHTDEQIVITLAETALWEHQQRHASRQIASTKNQQMVARLAMEQLGAGASGKLVADEDVVEERMHEA